jgi:small subunit ribosomal protein S16
MIGHYNPVTNPPVVVIDRARAELWISKGAQPSNTVRKLMANAPKPAPVA